MSDAGLNGTNVLLVGKTGVGKSSLLNYLYAREVAAWGSGKPVTPEGIHKLPSFFYNDLKVNPYDTAGMESGSAGKWFKELEAALLENGEQDIRDWFHTIIYCVDAQKSRLDDFEIKVIRSFLESGNRLILALTKCDIATSSQCEGLSAALSEEFPGLPQVRTAAGNQGGFAPPAPLRNGSCRAQLGRDELFTVLAQNLRASLLEKLLAWSRRNFELGLARARRHTLDFFEIEAGAVGFLTAYNENFKKHLSNEAESQYKAVARALDERFRANVQGINELTAQILKSYLNTPIPITPMHLELFDAAGFNTLDNALKGWLETFFKGIFGLTARKKLYKSATVEALEALEQQLREVFTQNLKDLQTSGHKLAGTLKLPLKSPA